MHRPGSISEQMEPDDFLCDFCARPWSIAQPFVEGHQGSCICGECLTTALKTFESVPTEPICCGDCTMCIETRKEPAWSVTAPALSPADRATTRICRRCSTQAKRTLERDPDSGWKRPTTSA